MNFNQIRAHKKINLSKMPIQDDSLVGRNSKNHVELFEQEKKRKKQVLLIWKHFTYGKTLSRFP